MSPVVMPVPYIALELPSEPASVGIARRRVAAFAEEHGATPETRDRIASAVSEAVTNAVVHGNPVGGPAIVSVAADVEDGDLEVVVADDGTGLAPGSTPGAGLGLGVIASSADALEVRNHLPSGVEVWMLFELGPDA